MATPSIANLRNSAYMRLLEFAAGSVGTPFTEQQATTATGVSPADFRRFVDVIYVDEGGTPSTFSVTIDALPKYIEFREFEETRSGAKSAQRVAVLSIVLSGALAGLQVYLQKYGDTRLDASQMQQFAAAASAIPTAINQEQSARLDAIAARLDATNTSLSLMGRSQEELVKKLSSGNRGAR